MSIRKGGGAGGADAASDEPRYHAPSLGPAWSIRVIAAAVAADEQEDEAVEEEQATEPDETSR